MKTLYLDIFSGISGDMFIGAMLDLGVDFKQLEKELEKLKLDDYHLHVSRATKATIEGVKFDVHLEEDHHHDHDHDEHGHHHHEHTHATHGHGHSHGSHDHDHDHHDEDEHHHDHTHEHEHSHG